MDNSAFAVSITVPGTEDIVNIVLGEWAQQLMEFGIGLVNDLAMQAVTELRHIGVEPDQFQVAGI